MLLARLSSGPMSHEGFNRLKIQAPGTAGGLFHVGAPHFGESMSFSHAQICQLVRRPRRHGGKPIGRSSTRQTVGGRPAAFEHSIPADAPEVGEMDSRFGLELTGAPQKMAVFLGVPLNQP